MNDKIENIKYLNELRSYELQIVLKSFSTLFQKGRVLELGSGTGEQLRQLKNRGFIVVGVEIEKAWYDYDRDEDIRTYDGKNLPFADSSFDLVFSSNVLEHIDDFALFQAEIMRVLKPGGHSLHITPSSSWRLWALISHYATLPSQIFRAASKYFSKKNLRSNLPAQTTRTSWQKLADALFPEKHGVFGNRFTEIYTFSKTAWLRRLEGAGWLDVRTYPVKIFYTSSHIMNRKLKFSTRSKIASILGSSSHIYVMTSRK